MQLEYTGQALAMLMAVSGQATTPAQWVWLSLWSPLSLPHNAESIDHLIAHGWVQSPAEAGSTILESQLYENTRLVDHEKQSLLCFYRLDQDMRPPVPIVLTFSIESIKRADIGGGILMLNPFPPPQFGENAFVAEGYGIDQMVPYHISDLPLEARRRWADLGDKLRAISAPSLWPAFTKNHALASDETAYQEAMRSIINQQRLAIGNTKAKLIVEGAHLKAAHIHVEQLREALKKNWRDAWQDIRSTARDLARDYYQHHLSLHPIKIQTTLAEPAEPAEVETRAIMQGTLPFASQVPITPAIEKEKKAKPARKRRQPAPPQQSPIVSSRKDYVHIKSDLIGLEIGRALQSRDYFKDDAAFRMSRYLRSLDLGKKHGEITIVIDIGDGREAWETINDALNTLDDGVSDTYYAITTLSIERNGIQRICDQFLISPDDILEVCRKAKSHGSYTPAQRAEVVKNLKTLSLCQVCIKIPQSRASAGKRGRPRRGEIRANGETYIEVKGALIDLLSLRIGEYSTITGDELWVKQSIAIGPWAKSIPGLSQSTAIMLREVLRYSGQNERYQKRIGIYLTHMFRYNAKYGGIFPHGIRIATLLEGAGIAVTKTERKNPGRFKDSIERALTVLQQDSVIGKYWEQVDSTNDTPAKATIEQEITERAYGWFDLWLTKKLNFSPPDVVKEHYQKLLRPAREAPPDGNTDKAKHPE